MLDIGLSQSLKVLSRDPSSGTVQVGDITFNDELDEWRFRIIDFHISNVPRAEIIENVHLNCGAKVCCWDWTEGYIAIEYTTGRVEVRRLDSPNIINALAYVSITIPTAPETVLGFSLANGPRVDDLSSLKFVRRPEGLFLVVSANEVYWFQVE